jgi:hypothetical protein
MPFYEVVYETGRMSVACYEDDAEAQLALKAHNDRALNGQAGGPLGQPAERVSAVYKYEDHPNEFNAEQTASADVVSKEVEALIKSRKDKNNVVSLDQLSLDVRGLSHPMNTEREGFDSFFKVKEDKKLDMGFLKGGNA